MGLRGESLTTLKSLGTAWSVSAKPCDSCKTAPSAVFCLADSASLCFACDSKIHAPNKFPTRHERVWMCEVCEHAPAAVTCKADAAALCVTCDADIHSANPLASRHERVPIEPFVDAAESIAKSPALDFLVVPSNMGTGAYGGACNGHAEVEAGTWLFPNSNSNPKPTPNANKLVEGTDHVKIGDAFLNDVDTFLDFEFGNSADKYPNSGMDSLVPVQTKPAPPPIVSNPISENCFEIDFGRSKLSPLTYLTQSMSQSVSSSSLDFGVVPDGNCMSEISYPLVQSVSSYNSSEPTGMTNSNTASQATQLCGLDREARVLRYREKRKNRKFEKTIRYASRKAYAETRPRIKGRFAKRTELDTEVDNIYGVQNSVFVSDAQYSVVPTF